MRKLDLQAKFAKARQSASGLRMLNRLLWIGIPFNKPHRLKITELTMEKAVVSLPYIRRNKNHINGMHACAIATGAEYVTGLLLLQALDASKYRLIMKKLEVEYHYQGKMDAKIEYLLPAETLQKEVIDKVGSSGVVEFIAQPEVYDVEGNHLATGHIHWQVKDWKQVKTGR